MAVLSFTIICIIACGGRDPGIPVTDGDDDDDSYEFDYEVIPEYDVEWESLTESRCAGISHNNDVAFTAAVGGTLAYCLPGDPLDGSSLILGASALSADARLLISSASDFEFAGGIISAGPAIKISAAAVKGTDAITLKKSAVLTLPLHKGLIASQGAVGLLVYYNIDGKNGVLDFAAVSADGDADSDEDVLLEEDVRYLIDSRNELLSLPIRSFGIYQIAMPESGARRK